ncbi:FRG domain-containing protein [Rhizobium sp. P38BS-XIX]|uniref:FRG domain-containing protein n=1 Tax=Rhizobium sp. P38BS-XIX TaxID=2726740 RepID=UPI0014565A50|nr:FRG domain-containing protein [Rhizobium sp. P38BS-XIX]NLR97766.1 FRG domain-containing protein [Rhizobium sp. P38BS-XIX]
MKMTTVSGPDALRWHIWQNYRDSRFLFRGENRDWGSTYSSLDRLQSSKQLPQHQWNEFDRRLENIVVLLDLLVNERPLFSSPSAALNPLRPASLIDQHDRLSPACLIYATLQHYGVPSPFVDLTENLETALFFASYPAKSETDVAVMFVVDSEQESIATRLARMPDTDLHRSSRHARQAAHGLCLRLGTGVRDVDYACNEDFRKLDGVVETITFAWSAEDRRAFNQLHQKLLIPLGSDKLGQKVSQACLHGLDEHAFDAIRVDEIFRRVCSALV